MIDRLNYSNEWKLLPWQQFENRLYNLQYRIFKASKKNGNKKSKVAQLQKLLIKSECARYLAIRDITNPKEGNKIKKVKPIPFISSKEKFFLAFQLKNISSLRLFHGQKLNVLKLDRKIKLATVDRLKNKALTLLLQYALKPIHRLNKEPVNPQAKDNYFIINSYVRQSKRRALDTMKQGKDASNGGKFKTFLKNLSLPIKVLDFKSYIKRTMKNSQLPIVHRLAKIQEIVNNIGTLYLSKLTIWNIKNWIYKYLKKNCLMDTKRILIEIHSIFNTLHYNQYTVKTCNRFYVKTSNEDLQLPELEKTS